MSNLLSPSEKAAQFLAIADQFRLGELPTEGRHPRTLHLSGMAAEDLDKAIDLLKSVEIEALRSAFDEENLKAMEVLAEQIKATLATGGRIFFCGCGATGRLSLSLETLWRHEFRGSPAEHSVLSFIAGGDYALVRSIENFEDHPEYGARQLRDLGFSKNDLLVATTEGGETPFVIGATEEATVISERRPWFLFCNPAETLKKRVERSRRVLENPKIHSVSLFTGPMAIAGSTRLQASTVLMLGAGAALFSTQNYFSVREGIAQFGRILEEADLGVLEPLIRAEAHLYEHQRFCCHRSDHYAITVITDTTERSPTFSLVPFENKYDPKPLKSWTYLKVPSAPSTPEAWIKILNRPPRPLDWENFAEAYGQKIIDGFTFHYEKDAEMPPRVDFSIDPDGDSIRFHLENIEAKIPRPRHWLHEQLLLKVAMNISSTLVMGRLKRFQGNLMLFVKPTNNKLIDRSIRFVQMLLHDIGREDISYEQICHTLFEVLPELEPEEAAVLKTFVALSKRP